MAQRQFRSDDTSVWNDRWGDGSDGARTISSNETDATANTTLTGTASDTAATAGSGTGFAAGNLVVIHQTQGTGAGAWELNKISSVGGGTNWTMTYPLMNDYATGAQVLLLKQHTTLAIDAGVVVTGRSWTTANKFGGIVAYLASTSITVSGKISVKGNDGQNNSVSGAIAGVAGVGFIGGSGLTPEDLTSHQGESATGAGAQATTANGMGGGGASAATAVSAAAGGGGGHAAAGEAGPVQGSGTGGTAGGTGGVAGLTTMVFGGAGGGAESGGATDPKSSGGSSGGIILLISKAITLQTDAKPLDARGGADGGTGQPGGAGAGGSILIKGQAVVLGTALADASKGVKSGGNGADGAAGRIHVDYASTGSLSGTTNPTLDSRADTTLDNPAPSSASTPPYSFFM